MIGCVTTINYQSLKYIVLCCGYDSCLFKMLDNVGKVRHLSAVNVFTACYLQLLWVRSAAICKKGRGNRQNCHMIDGFYEAKSHASPSRNPYMLH